MKFTHGQKVTCEIEGVKITDAKISIDKDGSPYICQNEKRGSWAEDRLGYGYSWKLFKDFTNPHVSNLRPLIKTIHDVEDGDMIKNSSEMRVVLGRAGKAIFISTDKEGKKAWGYACTAEELIESGYTIINPGEEEVEEITMSELCKRLGKTVKIKKD